MLHLKDISLGYKIPLRVALLVIVTASLLAPVLVYRSIGNLREIMFANADSLGHLIADTLIEPLLHDDVWRAFEIISIPFGIPQGRTRDLGAEYILVLDAGNKIFVSTQPERFPILSDPISIEPSLLPMVESPPELHAQVPLIIEARQLGSFYLATAIQTDGVRLGTLIVSYSMKPFENRFYSLIQSAILITLLVLAVLLPFGVYWARKMAAPLLQLSENMSRIAPNLPDPSEIELEETKDEIGQLAKSFKTMLVELKGKEQLQQQIIISDRLAAIGRLAAGVAHEINNPLGGMLNAISTYKRHGVQDPLTLKTLSILERGLQQIKETVAALLVETKTQARPFDLKDVNDICTLVQSDMAGKQVSFTCEIDIAGVLPVSSTLVRQIIINLLLNAVHATQWQGCVRLRIWRDTGYLSIDVFNDGSYIPKEKISYLFEPFTSLSQGGNGLGLWVIYQIVQQLNGVITVQSEPDETRFIIQLPLQETHE